MNRTFHRRITIQGCIMAALPAIMSFWCFWVRTGLTPVVGFAMLLLATAAIERLIHTTYTFTPDGMLIINNGHLSRHVSINIASITSTRPVNRMLIVASPIIIEYGARPIASLQPDNEKAFTNELQRRLNDIDKTQK